MDEPFGALDPITRFRLQNELRRLHREVAKTVIFVTHDIDEAIRMGDRIAILREGGVLAQYDTPDAILAHPADEFVAEFIGEDRALAAPRAATRSADVDLQPDVAGLEPELTAHPTTTLRNAVSLMLERETDALLVKDGDARARRASTSATPERAAVSVVAAGPVIPNFGEGSSCVTRRPHLLLGLGAALTGATRSARRSSQHVELTAIAVGIGFVARVRARAARAPHAAARAAARRSSRRSSTRSRAWRSSSCWSRSPG